MCISALSRKEVNMGKSFSTERGIVYIDGYADSSAKAIAKGYCFSFRTYKNETGGIADLYGKCSDELHHSFVVVRQ